MKNVYNASILAVFALAAILFLPGASHAYGPIGGIEAMTAEQKKELRDIFVEFNRKIRPVQHLLTARQAEYDALSLGGDRKNESGMRALAKEIGELCANIFVLRADMRKKMLDRDILFFGGMGRGFGGPMGGVRPGGYGQGGPGCGVCPEPY